MKLDDIASRAANDALESTQADPPPGVESIVVAAQRQARLWFVGTALATIALVAIIIGASGLVGRQTPAPEVTDMSVISTTTSPATTTLPSTTTATTITTEGVPVLPGLDALTAAAVTALPYPGATILTEDTLTDEVVRSLRDAASATGYDEEPTQINAAFEKDGVVYATVEYPSGETGYLSAENGQVVRFRHGMGPWTDLHIIRKGSWVAYIQISWIGLPDDATTAMLSTPQRPHSIEDQPVIGGAAFFEIGKPDWTQIGKLTLVDEEGDVVLTAEERLQGNSCSGYVVGPYLGDRGSLDPLEAGQVALMDAVNRCMPAGVADLAVGDGPYFDTNPDDRAAELRDADQRTALFRAMAFALSVGKPQEVATETGTLYVYRWESSPIEIDLPNGASTYADGSMTIELGFSEDGAWQYGVFVEE